MRRLLGLLFLAVVIAACGDATDDTASSAAATFVGSEACKTCHDDRHATWSETAHSSSLRAMTPEVVLGEFDGREVRGPDYNAYPEMRGVEYWLRIVWDDGRAPDEHRLMRLVGRLFAQCYLTESPAGAWQLMYIYWDVAKSEWGITLDVLSDLSDLESPDGVFDPDRYAFNLGCAQCHATRFDAGWDPETDRYDSTLLEGSVSCETCHGPGSEHVAHHEEKRSGAYAAPERLINPDLDFDAEQVLWSCGRCHYRGWPRFAVPDDASATFFDVQAPRNMDSQGFYADGSLSGLNYHGSTMSQSRCYLEGNLSCLHCHDLHGGREHALLLEPEDDRQCAPCHEELIRARTEHSHHTDLRCVDCHMPRLIDGIIGDMRDHSLRSPDPVLTERFGADRVPNACNECHEDESPTWAREWRETWWGPSPARVVEDTALISAFRDDPSSVTTADLIALATRTESRSFFRQSAIYDLRDRGGARVNAAFRRLLDDPRPEIRILALTALADRADAGAMDRYVELLESASRIERVEAAYALAAAGWTARGQASVPLMEAVYTEALEMRERRRPYDGPLLRLSYIADALDRADEMHEHMETLAKRTPRYRTEIDPPAARLLARYAVRRLDEEEPARLIAMLERAARGAKPPVSQLLDRAEIELASGDEEAAHATWRTVRDRTQPGTLERALAVYRLARLRGPADDERAAVEQAQTKIASDPAAGLRLRRAERVLSD